MRNLCEGSFEAVTNRFIDGPVVLPLGEGAGAAQLGAGLPLPGHDGACAGPHEHEGPYQVPGGL